MNSHHAAATVLLLTTLGLIAVPTTKGDELTYEFEVEKAPPLGNKSLQEVSGVTRSHLFSDTFWAHNDSGDKARLFAITREGEVICPPFLRTCPSSAQGISSEWEGHTIEIAMNYDWEDIAVLDGHLLIADTGNNGNARRDLGIYRVPEFNPRAVDKTRALAFYPIAYPEQSMFPAKEWEFDAEAIFVADGQVYLVTKHRASGSISTFKPGAKLYRVTLDATERANLAELIAVKDDLAVVTAADVNPSEELLAVLGYQFLWLFSRPELEGEHWFSRQVGRLDLRSFEMGQVESVAFTDDQELMIISEPGARFLVRWKRRKSEAEPN